MRKTTFIIALLFIGETLFRLFPCPADIHRFFPLNPIELATNTYLYFIFEYVKVIGLSYILSIENARYRWVLYLFIADLAIYLLNYTSTLCYISGFPVGMDLIKLGIFGVVIIYEALNYNNGRDTDFHEHRNFIVYAHGHVPKTLWDKSLKNFPDEKIAKTKQKNK